MGLISGLFRPRVWFQLAALALLVGGLSYALAALASDHGEVLTTIQQADSPAAPATGAAGSYTRSVVATFTYGSAAAQLGRRDGPERRPVGPVSFAIDGAGRIAIADDVNGRIQLFDPSGKHLRSAPAKARIHDLAVGATGDIYALGSDGSLTTLDGETGQQKARGSVSAGLAKSLGLLGVVGDTLSLTSPDQLSYSLSESGKALPAADQAVKKKGAKTPTGSYYTTSYRDRGHVYQLDGQGKVVRDISLNLPDVASVNFLAGDKAGSVYVQVERFGAKNQILVEVRRLDSKGALTATIPLTPVSYVDMTRSALVTNDGAVYQLLPTENGVSLLRWQKP